MQQFEKETIERQLNRWKEKNKTQEKSYSNAEELYWVEKRDVVRQQKECLQAHTTWLNGMAIGSYYQGLRQKLAYDKEQAGYPNQPTPPAVSSIYLDVLEGIQNELRALSSVHEFCNGDLGEGVNKPRPAKSSQKK